MLAEGIRKNAARNTDLNLMWTTFRGVITIWAQMLRECVIRKLKLCFLGRFSDGGKEATTSVVAIQTWALGQVVALFLAIQIHPHVSQTILFLFIAVGLFPAISLLSIIGAEKLMRDSTVLVHQFDRNSVCLAWASLILGTSLLTYSGCQYARGQLPGQRTEAELTIKEVVEHEFTQGSEQHRIKPGQKGLVARIEIGKDSADPVEAELRLDKSLVNSKWVITGARGFLIDVEGSKAVVPGPVLVATDDSSVYLIYWHGTNRNDRYELEIAMFSPAVSADLKAEGKKIKEEKLLKGTTFVVGK